MCPCEISECLLLQFCSMSCRDTARRVRRFQRRKILLETFRPDSKNHRAGTKTHRIRVPEKADPTERSWRGVLRGHVPSKSPSADGEMLRAHASGHTEKGTKSGSFLRGANKTAPRVKPERKSKSFARSRWDVANGFVNGKKQLAVSQHPL